MYLSRKLLTREKSVLEFDNFCILWPVIVVCFDDLSSTAQCVFVEQVKFCTSSGADAVLNNFHWVLDQREKAEKHHRERVYHQWIVIGARRWEDSLEKQGECFVSQKKEPSANFDLIGLWVPARPAKCTSHQSLQQYNTHLLVYWHLPTTYLPT